MPAAALSCREDLEARHHGANSEGVEWPVASAVSGSCGGTGAPWAGSVERIPDVVWAPYQSLFAGPWLFALLLGSLGGAGRGG